MNPAIFTIALLLGSAVGVWGLVLRWRRSIARRSVTGDATAGGDRGPFQHALYGSGVVVPGAQALTAQPLAHQEDAAIRWSARFAAAVALELRIHDEPDAVAVVAWSLETPFESWFSEPAVQARWQECGAIYPGFELSGEELRAELRSSLVELPTAFDLLCLVANAAVLSSPPGGDRSAANCRHGVGWSAGGFAHGALPPFGRVEVSDRSVVLSADNRIPADSATPGRPDFLAHSLSLPVDTLTLVQRPDGSVSLQGEQTDVVLRALDGAGVELLDWLRQRVAAP